MDEISNSAAPMTMNRREAIKRAALMLGTAVSASTMTAALHAQTRRGGDSWKPQYLNQNQANIAGAIAERIIPRTDTPGALDVGVKAFIDVLYGKYMTAEEQAVFAKGLTQANGTSRKMKDKGFLQLSPDEQDAVLKAIAAQSEGKSDTFFHKIREATLAGYFTSEEVAKNVFRYDPIPGRYEACVPYEKGQRDWAY